MTEKSPLETERERAQRIALPDYDEQSQSAVAAYISELESEKIREESTRPRPRRIRI